MDGKRVVVVAGGLSHEREVSLRSGRRVADALGAIGHSVCVRDLDTDLLGALSDDHPDCVIPLLHGEDGEDGTVQEMLDLSGFPYVGSARTPAQIAFDKPVAKQLVARAGVSTPDSLVVGLDAFRQAGVERVTEVIVDRLGLPLVVKPARGGSALGCSIVRSAEEIPQAISHGYSYGNIALVERYVNGAEVAVPVIDRAEGPRALPAVEIRPDDGFYDYTARYTAGATEFVVPADCDQATTAECARLAELVHHHLGLRDVSRCDLIIDDSGQPWFLEANVAPGMTETSLVPLAIQAADLELGAVFGELVDRAVSRTVSV